MKKTLLIFLFYIIVIVHFLSQESYTNLVSSFLNEKEITNAHVGIYLQNQNGKELINYNGNKLFIPASVQKLFTTAFILNLLPKDYVISTFVLSNGKLDSSSNSLVGNLIIKTFGDPSLESRYFKSNSFLKKLKLTLIQLKIDSIYGKILVFPNIDNYEVNNQWLWSDIGNYYGTGFSVHTFKDNYVEVFFSSNANIGDTTLIKKIHPNEKSFSINNHVIVGSSKRDLSYAYGSPYQSNRLMKGTIPINKQNYPVKVSMHDPKLFLQSALENLISELGIQVQSKNTTYQPLDTLLIHYSPSLIEMIKCINYQSNNSFAEHLLMKALESKTPNIMYDEAAEKLESFWKEELNLDEIIFKDGCGLSRLNLASPCSINSLLIYQINSNTFPDFLKSLPAAGVSGTLKYIGNNTAIEGNFIGKSGSMSGVRCYSGYFLKKEQYFPFTIMVNNFTTSDYIVRKYIEDLMVAIYQKI
tara:strand:+ start:2235 stop:3647 length:1413 start_codon:yes stop_codon:yes gene_type:complete